MECLEIQQNSPESFPPEKSRRPQNFLGYRNEGPKTSSFDYKYVLSPRHLLLFDIHLSHIMSPLYPGQLAPFRFETEPKSKLNRTKLNVAERRAATRVSM